MRCVTSEHKRTKPKLDNQVCEPPLAEIAPPWEPSEGEGGIVDSEDDCVNFLASLDISEDANVCYLSHIVIPLPFISI